MNRYKIVYLDSNKNQIRSTDVMSEDRCDIEEMMFNMLPKYGEIRKGLTAVKKIVGNW